MDKWDAAKRILDESDLCLFLKKDGVMYGGTEDSRITFARMKNPESKEDHDWAKEATLAVYDLEKSQDGKKVMTVMNMTDIKKLVPMDADEVEKELEKKGKKLPVIRDDESGEKTYGEK
jgi:hypothetical protein